ncbi:PepSY domain-containing protein [uncultured Paracoccus sp.]|uniref:PepSY domain-containing protein n=1 Tax=uncultured Paracoccus sp. TaxID=189685 RepID=UPI0025DEEDF2|nr:PepSY domain-containing protein [uncultured Paracoccus sp.]
MPHFLSPLKAATVALLAMSGAALADSEEVALMRSAQQSLADAIAAAEQETGGKAIEAEFDEERGMGYWEITTVTETARFGLKLDANSGQIVERSERTINVPAMPQADLTELIAQAEADGNGRVMSIDAEHRGGSLIGYEVEIVGADGRVLDYFLNLADNSLTPDD